MLIPGIRKNYPKRKIEKGGKPLFLHGKDSVLQDFRRMFHVKHSGRKQGAFGSGIPDFPFGNLWKK